MFSIMHSYSLTNYAEKTEYDFNITDKDIEIIIRWKREYCLAETKTQI